MARITKRLTIIFLSLLMIMPLFAHGKGDIEELKVENVNSWQEQFDLENKKAGKYNIMITARDLGGNTRIEGPHNIYLDPNSDLPVCGITNPYSNMRVVGNLNIVGTCVDDDGVSKVELILDEGTPQETRVTAEGQEFWSYYLDTNSLAEGPHTIKVIGYDINAEPVASKPVSLTWQLDRKQPVTEIEDKAMGVLVSGNVKFDGYVSDGNGIKELYYSTDNGKNFIPVKLNANKSGDICTFTVNVDTKQFPDGPEVLWFKAIDKATSVGMYSFLYFVDNTKPDVQIVSPVEDQVMNGKFTVAGFAKDTIGVTDLSWTFGTESGTFDLIPGNPYWAVTLNTINSKDKSQKFTVHAVDRAKNVVEVTRNIPLDQEADKPVVTTSEPVEAQVFGDSDRLFVRGIARDDDGVKAVKIQLDAGEPLIQETKGVYYLELCGAEDLSVGAHKVTITAIDVNDVEGNPVVTNISSKGIAPVFADAKVVTGKESAAFENGTEIHPESGSSINVTANSGVGLTKVHTELTWGTSGIIENDVELKNLTAYTVSLPVTPDSPKGVIQLKIKATDSIERESEYKTVFFVTNTSVVKNEEPVLVFDDSRVSPEGIITNILEFPASGYLYGAEAASVELVPSTPFATADLVGNQVRLIPQMDAAGTSEPVVVRVKTTTGKTVDSTPIRFANDTAVPYIEFNDLNTATAINVYVPPTPEPAPVEPVITYDEEGNPVETMPEPEPAPVEEGPDPAIVNVTGKVTCPTGVGALNYRILPVAVDIQKGLIASAKAAPVNEDYTGVTYDAEGNFAITLDTTDYATGMYVVELIAESSGGNKAARAFAITKIPDLEPVKGKMPAAKAPLCIWIDAFDTYAVGVYQGKLSEVVTSDGGDSYYQDGNFHAFRRLDMLEGNNALTETFLIGDTGKGVTGKFTAVKKPSLSANIAYVNDQEYTSGMPVLMDYATKAGGTITVYLDTGATVSSVSYEFTGDSVAGGDVTQKGAAKIYKPTADNPMRWVAEIPLANLPARVNKLSVTVKAGAMEQTIRGSIKVVRSVDPSLIDDDVKVYGMAAADTSYDEVDKNYILTNGSKYFYYANLNEPLEVSLASPAEGLSIETNGKLITLSAEKDGIYKNVSIKVKDRFGDSYTSEPLNFIANTSMPEVHILTPELFQWVNNTLKLSGTATHPLGIRSVEYSLDNGTTWEPFTLPSGKGVSNIGVTFSQEIKIDYIQDGLVEINVRATDVSGHSTTVLTSAYKDVTPPVVSVVEPLEIDVVNGENLIVFDAKDNAYFAKAEYVAPPVKGKESVRIDLPLDPLVSTLIGTTEAPIDDAMSFVFSDDAGNKTTLEAWAFSIDNESDLPRAEIHVPEDMQVITRDFTVSGVVYDDDGESSIFYKIDDGEYKQVSTNEIYKSPDSSNEYVLNTSFSIQVPLSTMTDNEHTVTVYAVDVNGVKGPEVSRTYRVSLEEPKGAVELPTIDTSVRQLVTISGWASDKNGIEKIEVSLDNGNSFNDAVGTENWSYTVDTRAIPGGTQVVFLRVTDKYGITGLYSSLINIDNDAPEVNLELPLDDSSTTGELFFSGYTFDNVEVTELYLTIRNLEKTSKPDIRNMKIDRIIGQTMDIRDLEDGFYNIELTGKDKAGNVTNVSRNIHLEKNRAPATVDVLYPLNGEHKEGVFTIYGQSSAESEIDMLKLYIDNKLSQETKITDCGFFKFDMNPENITEGTHTYRVDTVLTNGTQVASRDQTITYSSIGPWVTIENFTYGDFATGRPYIRGQAGYSIGEDELLFSKTKEATAEQKAATAAKSVAKIELSFDNGKTFQLVSTNEKWMYRIENQDIAEGYHFMLVRATMKNGETAITRTIIQIDNTEPTIRLISPTNGGHYNQKLKVSGLSNDDVKLEDVTVTLRKGDKSSYEIPSFIQGLYIDFRFWGDTLFSVGAGLTFFNDVVKVQASYGQFTQAQRDAVSEMFGLNLTNMRYGGDVFSLKILANVAEIPFSFFLGHDWDWLYADVAVGADFSYFTETNSGKPQILSAVLGQLEFPKIKLQNVKAFSTFSLYIEGSVWFIPTDVSSTVQIKNIVPQVGIGFRTNIF